MAYAMNDRVREQVSGFGGGTGAVTLTVTAVSGFQTFLAGWGASGTGEYLLVLGSQWETGLGTLNAGGTTLTRTTPKNGSSGVGVAVNFSAGTLDCSGNIPANIAKSLPAFGGNFALINGRINCTVAASALTIAIKTSANTDPTAADPVFVVFRDATIATGDYAILAVTAATSLVISSGSTLGFLANTISALHVVGFNDAGTFRLGAINIRTNTSLLNEAVVRSSTAEGGAGGATSAEVFYTGTAVTSKAMRVLAYLEWSGGIATAGTWASVPTTVHLLSDQPTTRPQVYAAPFDALASTGIQLNGSCEVSQENGTTAVVLATGTPAYVVDGWQGTFVRAATLAISCQQVTPPGSPAFQSAFQQALQIKATTGLASLATGDYGILEHLIEGYRASRLSFGASSAGSVTVGFWVYATIAGTMTVTLENSAANRAIPVNVTISAATTWEYKTVTFAGDTSGTWLFTTGIGLRVRFCFGAGATFQGTNNTWAGSNVFATSSTTNFFASTNNLACITGVVVLPGNEAPARDRSPFIMRPFDQEHLALKRYYEKSYAYGTALATASAADGLAVLTLNSNTIAASQQYGSVAFSVQKRASPTMTIYGYAGGSGKVSNDAGTDLGASSGATFWVGETRFSPYNNSGGPLTTSGFAVLFHWLATARL